MVKIVKKHTGLHYVLTEIQLYTLILLQNEYIIIEALNEIRDKSIIHNIFGIQGNESIICRFDCIAVIELMHAENFVGLY